MENQKTGSRIYGDRAIAENKLYGGLMSNINELYGKMGNPSEFCAGEIKTSTTTGDYNDDYWDSDEIGDFNGDEDQAADFANAQLEVVFDGLRLSGNGGISHYYLSEEWADFVEQALDLLEDYHSENIAYDFLCEI